MKHKTGLIITILLFVVFSSTAIAQLTGSRSGRLDREYAEDGMGTYATFVFSGDSLVLDDGSLLQLSTTQVTSPSNRFVIQLRKFTSNGFADVSFGNKGRRSYDLGHDAGGIALARSNDGKFLIGGSVNPSGASGELDFLVLRIHSNGDIDTSFGVDGSFIGDFPSPVQGQATMDSIDVIHVLHDGKILATGTSTRKEQSQFGISHARSVMLNPDGSLDVSFGVDGSVATNIGYGDYVPAGSQDSTSAIDHQGRIMIGVVPYFEADNPSNFGCKVLRYLPNGSLDPSFGEKGVKVMTPGQISRCADLAFVANGKILVLTGWSLMLLNEDGSSDPSFAGNGTLILGPFDHFSDILVTADGKLCLAGHRQVNLNPGYTQYAIVRAFHPDGTPDLRFGSLGTASVRMPDNSLTSFRRLHLTNNGLVSVGSRLTFTWQMTLTRFTFAR